MNTRAWLLLAITASLSTAAHAGQGVWTTNGPYGGDIRALAIDPVTPSTLYAGAYGGGVFKSTDRGGRWNAVNKGLSNTYVLSLVVDPSASDTLYAGSEGGLFKSTNGGENWTAVNVGPTVTHVTTLAVDPRTPATLYAGTSPAGVLKSTNGGERWTATNVGLTATNVISLAIDPSAPATLYAGTSYGGGIFKSTDAGGNWTPLLSYNAEFTALAIDPSAPANIYAGSSSFDWPPGGVFKSANGGADWTDGGLGGRNVLALAIDPSAPATLYAGTDNGILKSPNRGESWTEIGLTNPGAVAIPDVFALAIDPSAPATLYAGTRGTGVFKSSNRGGSWTVINAGLIDSTVTALAIDPSAPATLYASTWGGGVFKSSNGGGGWTAINAGLTDTFVSALVVDPSAPATLYAGSSGGVFKSTDGGATWVAANSGLTHGYLSVAALAIDPSAPATLYAGTGDGVFKSANGGGNWAAVNSGFPDGYHSIYALEIGLSAPATLYALTNGGVFKSITGGTNWTGILVGRFVSALAIDPSAAATLYAASAGVFKSTDGGGNWVTTNTGLTNLSVQALAINPTTPSTLYAGTSGGVFRSTDSGGTWAAFNSGLPTLPVDALALDPVDGTTVYAGLEGGGVWQLTTPTAATVTALLPASAHSSGANGAFYTTDVSVANTGALPASVTLKFLGHDQDGSKGPERTFDLDPGESRTFVDVLGSVFDQSSNFGAIRITSNTSTLDVVSVTSTPGFGGTFGQAIPAVAYADLIPAGASRSVLYVREGDGFRSNLILASGSSVSTDVDVALVLPAGDWDYARTRRTLAMKTYSVPPNGMIQVNRVVRDMGISGPVTGARLVLSSATAGALFTGLASVIDETTNDPTAILAQSASVPGSAPYTWLLPASAHSSGANGAFYTTNVSVANVGAAPASFTMEFLGNNGSAGAWDYVRQGTEQTFSLESGKSVIYFDVLGSVFNETSSFGAIRVTSSSPSLNIVSVTSTPGFGGTLSQTVPAVSLPDLIPAGSQRSILYIREGDGFRSNLVLASNASVPTTIDTALVTPAGETFASKSYSVPPSGMTQINRVVRDMGVSGSVTGARLVLSSSTPGAAFTAFASVIDEITNDATAVEAK